MTLLNQREVVMVLQQQHDVTEDNGVAFVENYIHSVATM